MKKLTEAQKVRRRWVKALRSGQYRKTTGNLVTSQNGKDSFCCLGVLCDLAVRAGVIAPPESNDFGYLMYGGGSYDLPVPVRVWAGLTSSSGTFDEKIRRQYSLVNLNDDVKGFTFKKIADVIEREPEGLVVNEA